MELIRPAQIAEQDDPPVALDSGRPDFDGALAQFLVGLLQTAVAPDDHQAWEERFLEPPTPAELDSALARYASAFDVDGVGPRFMQDMEPFEQLEEKKKKKMWKPISFLLIDAPGEETLKRNFDHFVKRGRVEALCPRCAVTALWTLQLNAPSGGSGHRTSLRGGGPLTTLVRIDPERSGVPETLWSNTWINVLPQTVRLTGNKRKRALRHIFPWLAPTRTSGKDGGVITTPEDAHPLQMYWAMPRRVRLDFDRIQDGCCDLCGTSGPVLNGYYTVNLGVNYEGAWSHPFSPYKNINKGSDAAVRIGPEGIAYQYWVDWVFHGKGGRSAIVVEDFLDEKKAPNEQFRLWAFGYHMDNAKARGWYEATLPLYRVPEALREVFVARVTALVEAAQHVAENLRDCIKAAWFGPKKTAQGGERGGQRKVTVKGDLSSIEHGFYERTEGAFYAALQALLRALPEEQDEPVRAGWAATLAREALALFDEWAASGDFVHEEMARIAPARSKLLQELHGTKSKLRKTLNLPADKEAA